MYFVKYGESYLHDPRKDGYNLLDLSLTTEENSCGYCDFTIYPDHPMHGKLKERDADNPIEVYDDDTLLFAGFIYELGEEFYLDGHVQCKGEMDYLSETLVRPYSSNKRGFGSVVPEDVGGYFEWLIMQHNDQVGVNKQFVVGINQASELDPDDYYDIHENDGYPTTIEAITKDLIECIGGYIRIRHDNGVRYIDYIAEWSDTNAQILDFGVNLTNYTKTDNSESVATCIIPLGASLRQTEYRYDDGYALTTDKVMNPKKEYYTHPYNRCGKIAEFEGSIIMPSNTIKIGDVVMIKDTATKYYAGQYIPQWVRPIQWIVRTLGGDRAVIDKSVDGKYSINSPIHVNDLRLVNGGTLVSDIPYYEQYTDTFVTKDTSPVQGIDYYVISSYDKKTGAPNYTRQDISRFVSGVTYYEREPYYVPTTDTIPNDSKTYYIYDETSYSRVSNLGRFRKHDTYYEYNEFNDESNLSLTIEDCDIATGDVDIIKDGDMLYSLSGVRRYGYIQMVTSYSDINLKEDLITNAILDLKEVLSPKRTIEVRAVDMHLVNKQIKSICVGEYVRVRSKPHGLDSYFLCASIELDLNNPENSLYILGTTYDTLTGQQNKQIKSLNATVNHQYESVSSSTQTAIGNMSNNIQTQTDNIKNDVNSSISSVTSQMQESAGLAVTKVVEEYAVTVTPDAEPIDESNWSSEPPGFVPDKYIWHRFVVTYGSGTITTSEPCLLVGTPGEDGEDGKPGEDAVLLRIDSSRGTVFKNDSISTVLSAVIYKGSERITDVYTLHNVFGAGAYLQWYWQKIDDDSFGIISSSDSRVGQDGFTLSINPEDVDTKVTFMCELIV